MYIQVGLSFHQYHRITTTSLIIPPVRRSARQEAIAFNARKTAETETAHAAAAASSSNPTRRKPSKRSTASSKSSRSSAAPGVVVRQSQLTLDDRLDMACCYLDSKPHIQAWIAKVAKWTDIDCTLLSARFRRFLKEKQARKDEVNALLRETEIQEDASSQSMFTLDQEMRIMDFVKRHEEGITLDDLRLFVRACIHFPGSVRITTQQLDPEVQRMKARHPDLVYDGPEEKIYAERGRDVNEHSFLRENNARPMMLNRFFLFIANAQPAVRTNSASQSKSTKRSEEPDFIGSAPSAPSSSPSLNSNTEPMSEDSEHDEAISLSTATKQRASKALSSLSFADNPKFREHSLDYLMAYHLLRARNVVEQFRKPLKLAISFLDTSAEKAVGAKLFDLAVMIKEEAEIGRAHV